MTALTNVIPAEDKDLLLKLRTAEDRPTEALAGDKELTRARAWLARILVDRHALALHTDWLCAAYEATFRPPLPRRLREGWRPSEPSGSRFRYHALLPEPLAARILDAGVAQLAATDLGALLLNPDALWDLADRIDTDLPEHWLALMDEVGEEISRELGVEI